MPRLKLTLAYVGTRFSGWQIQPRARTVQLVVEEAVSAIVGAPVRAQGSARTDAGVHALCQVAHVDVPERCAHIPWRRALNAKLPEDLAVIAAAEASPAFHARFDSIGKTYAYHLWLTRDWVYPQRRPFVWRTGPLDLDLMDRAAGLFVGRQDFAAFQNVGTPVSSSVRTVFSFTRTPGDHPEEIVWRISADGFLKQMVRNIMGCLVEAGRGKVSADAVRSLLMGRDRTLAPATAPARGLCLERVDYGDGPNGDQIDRPEHSGQP
jgi:tRNA pseudouridine38-40 synthase